MKAIAIGVGVIAAAVLCEVAAADIYTNSYGLGISPFITFDEFGPGAKNGTEWQPEYGITFIGANMETNDYDVFPGIEGMNLLAYADPMFSFVFDDPVIAFASAWITNTGTTTFTAYLGETMVDQATVATDYQNESICYAVFENMTFDRIDATIDASFTSMRIDNLQRIVPAPGAFLPLLFGMMAGRRRRA
jgi:hypothetical protein